jgi:hypothetical protein
MRYRHRRTIHLAPAGATDTADAAPAGADTNNVPFFAAGATDAVLLAIAWTCGRADGPVDGLAFGLASGLASGLAYGLAYGRAETDRRALCGSNGGARERADGTSDCFAHVRAFCGSNGGAHEHADGTSDGLAYGPTDEHAVKHPDGIADDAADGLSE